MVLGATGLCELCSAAGTPDAGGRCKVPNQHSLFYRLAGITMVDLTFKRPKCRNKLTADENLSGSEMECPYCTKPIIIPRREDMPLKSEMPLTSVMPLKAVMKKSSIVIICFAGFGLLVGLFIWHSIGIWSSVITFGDPAFGNPFTVGFIHFNQYSAHIGKAIVDLFLWSCISAALGGYSGYRLSRTPPK